MQLSEHELTAALTGGGEVVVRAQRKDVKVRMEGKDYVMADGDVVEFRFNV